MTHADIMLFDVLDRMYPEVDVDSSPMSKLEPTGEVIAADGKRKMAFEGEEYPRVKAMMEAVAENEGIKKYLESRQGGDNIFVLLVGSIFGINKYICTSIQA